eukprot:1447005-Pyramimonas_sp.AAC.1
MWHRAYFAVRCPLYVHGSVVPPPLLLLCFRNLSLLLVFLDLLLHHPAHPLPFHPAAAPLLTPPSFFILAHSPHRTTTGVGRAGGE